MVEKVTTSIIRCDACRVIIESGLPHASLFTKDFCGYCACEILSDIGKKPILDIEEFLEIVDDYKTSFRVHKSGNTGIQLC